VKVVAAAACMSCQTFVSLFDKLYPRVHWEKLGIVKIDYYSLEVLKWF
jgi:hypothetical protein